MSMKTLGIVGFGNFGQFTARHLKPHFDITVSDAHDIAAAAKKMGVKAAPLSQTAACDIILLAVPVQQMQSVLAQIKSRIKPNAIVIDVASVKQKPAKLMEKLLPNSVQLVGTHPLFGPQSGKNGIQGLEIVVCPVRAENKTTEKLESFLQTLGLRVIRMSPAEHDEWMARTQAVAHFIGRAVKEIDLPHVPFKLATYDALLALRDLVKDDSDELFQTIQQENPYAETERKKLLATLEKLEKSICKPRRDA